MPPSEAGLSTARLPKVPGYELLGELGRGGMGVVYQARHLALQRLVALKMILSGSHAGAQDLLRFRTEAEAVARLQHPNVVQIYEIGEQEGWPYFSLEFCAGGSLEKILNGTPLRPAEAATLVETLARAMHAAHQHGIVHRDLKPANILLSFSREPAASAQTALAAGSRLNDVTPKITDFGLAKKLDDTSGQTQSGAIVGTPSYMAPEQASGHIKEIGPAADIYALGAILYECLTGRPPFKAATPVDTVLQVIGNEPAAPRQVQPDVPRDLETICLKCLQKDAVRRYGSALALADDLQRFREGRPILARPVGVVERAWRWCRRNLAVAMLLLAVAVTLVAGTAVACYFAWQAEARARDALAEKARADDETAEARRQELLAQEQRQRAETSYRLAREGLEQCVGRVRNDPRLQQGPLEDLRRTIMQAEAEFYQKFVNLRDDDPAFQLERGRAWLLLAWITRELGNQAEAVRQYQQGLAILQALVRNHPETPEYRLWLARGANDLGVLYGYNGQHADSEKLLREAITVQEALARDWPNEPSYRYDLAKHRGNLGAFYKQFGRWDPAEQELRAAADLFQALVRDYPQERAYRADLAHTYNNLGLLCDARQQTREAERWLREALALHQALATEYPQDAPYRNGVGRTYAELANVYAVSGQFRDAEDMFRKAVGLQKALVAEHPALPEYRVNLANTWSSLALLFQAMNRAVEAEEAFQEAARLWEPLVRTDPRVGVDLGGIQCDLGSSVRKRNRAAESLAWYARAITTLDAVLAREPKHTTAQRFLCNAYRGRAESLTVLRRYAEASSDWEKAADLAEAKSRPWFRLQHAATLAHAGEHAKAAAEAEQLVRDKVPNAGTLYDTACVYALCAKAAGEDRPQAEAYAVRAVALLRQAVGRGYKDIEHLKKDTDLDAVRLRADFRRLLAELEGNKPATLRSAARPLQAKHVDASYRSLLVVVDVTPEVAPTLRMMEQKARQEAEEARDEARHSAAAERKARLEAEQQHQQKKER
jgi:tetratricopeptide (TPR) repeat protein